MKDDNLNKLNKQLLKNIKIQIESFYNLTLLFPKYYLYNNI